MEHTHATDTYTQLLERPSTFQFPTSSARHDVREPKSGTTGQRYDPLGILKEGEDSARRAAALATSTTYGMKVRRPCRIAPGVLSDGSITIGHPEISCFLQSAEANPRVEPPRSPAMFALAALAVFYHPNRPAHWVFWAKDKRESTASVVQKVIDAQPIMITSPISWIGIPESLWVLGNLQYGWRDELAKTAWYGCFVDATAVSGRMNLRKRKGSKEQAQIGEGEDGSDEMDSPPARKRAKTRRIMDENCVERKEKTVSSDTNNEEDGGGQKRTSERQRARRAKVIGDI